MLLQTNPTDYTTPRGPLGTPREGAERRTDQLQPPVEYGMAHTRPHYHPGTVPYEIELSVVVVVVFSDVYRKAALTCSVRSLSSRRHVRPNVPATPHRRGDPRSHARRFRRDLEVVRAEDHLVGSYELERRAR